jgi:phospholipid/cholesterol/gamma-HCH transport system substrate-binding protein
MSSAAKVGVFMVVILLIAGYLIIRIEDISFTSRSDEREITAVFDSVAGLDEKSAVRVAGVRKGRVQKIEVTPDGRASVTMRVAKDVQLRRGATARVASLGLLGEKYVELDPGPPSAPPIPPGEPVRLTGSQPASIEDVTSQVSEIALDVKAITESLRAAMGGPEGERRVVDIFENVRSVTERVRFIIEANESNVNATFANFRAITDDLRVEIPKIAASVDSLADSLSGTVGENRADVREVVTNLRGLSADLRVTADHLNAITGQVRGGEGTVGKLLFSDEAHERLTSALSAVEGGVGELRDTLGRVGRLGLDVGIRSDYYAGLDRDETNFEGSARSSVLVNLIPNPELNRFYHVALSDDPKGTRREKIVETTTTLPDGSSSTIAEHRVKYERDFLISAQAGWQLDELSLRIGLFDSTGGVGADYRFGERLSVTGEVFDFGNRRAENPHLRLFTSYTVRQEKKNFPLVFVSTGVDNVFNDTAFTIGGGIRWRDDDLKYLLGSVPVR